MNTEKTSLENENQPCCLGAVMRSFSLEQYKQMAYKFNKMSFRDKIITLQKNSDILTLGSDYNWWVVKVKNKDIQEELYESEANFKIQNEWDYNEMCDLVNLLGLDNTDA
jgi:hypothetical protein